MDVLHLVSMCLYLLVLFGSCVFFWLCTLLRLCLHLLARSVICYIFNEIVQVGQSLGHHRVLKIYIHWISLQSVDIWCSSYVHSRLPRQVKQDASVGSAFSRQRCSSDEYSLVSLPLWPLTASLRDWLNMVIEDAQYKGKTGQLRRPHGVSRIGHGDLHTAQVDELDFTSRDDRVGSVLLLI